MALLQQGLLRMNAPSPLVTISFFHLSPPAGRGRSASALRVKGSLRKDGTDHFKHTVDVSQNVVVPEPQDSIFVSNKPIVANDITCVFGMLPTINFDDQATSSANEVHGAGTDRLLPDKLMPVKPSATKATPGRRFSIRLRASQFPGAFCPDLITRAHVDTPPHPSRYARRPLPASGERCVALASP
jgi:hypothetical protein